MKNSFSAVATTADDDVRDLLTSTPFRGLTSLSLMRPSTFRNPETNAHKCVRFFSENANAVLFLTATPLEMGTNDLYVLLNLLRPDLVRDPHTFEIMTAPNPFINAAAALAREPDRTGKTGARKPRSGRQHNLGHAHYPRGPRLRIFNGNA